MSQCTRRSTAMSSSSTKALYKLWDARLDPPRLEPLGPFSPPRGGHVVARSTTSKGRYTLLRDISELLIVARRRRTATAPDSRKG